MNRFLKLVNFEVNRFLRIYLVLIGITILFQMIAVITSSREYLSRVDDLIYRGSMPKKMFLDQYGTFTLFDVTNNSLWFISPIFLSIAALIFYVFFIWYRDWFGKNTFIYRLLMLPTDRMNVYLAKFTTILLFVFGLVALQLLLLPLEGQVVKWMVPNEFYSDMTIYEIIKNNIILSLIIPRSFFEFVLAYGIGITAVLIVFTAVLFERSFRLKGIIYGIIYCALSLFIFLLPILVDVFVLRYYFYPIELFIIEVVVILLLLAGALWIGSYLIRNKIRV
ncbi:hypothetical protein R4Z10_02635 [Niallia sp. XMNu-256]|uniref:hypothetical protein n=1 Tax=Niallia sp. XMNu-256 TaxID=3082444 RepID=UPI0030D5537F